MIFVGLDPTRESGLEVFADRVGSGPGVIEMSWVSPGRIRALSSLTGRTKSPCLGPNRARSDRTREEP